MMMRDGRGKGKKEEGRKRKGVIRLSSLFYFNKYLLSYF